MDNCASSKASRHLAFCFASVVVGFVGLNIGVAYVCGRCGGALYMNVPVLSAALST